MNEIHPEIQRIKSRRKSLGVTQDVLSEKSGVSKSAIAQLEAGMRKRPSFDTVKALDSALDEIAKGNDKQAA